MCVCIYLTFFFIHSYIDGHFGFSHVLLIVNNVAMHMGMQISLKTVISLPSKNYPEVKLLDHMVGLFKIFLGTAILKVVLDDDHAHHLHIVYGCFQQQC